MLILECPNCYCCSDIEDLMPSIEDKLLLDQFMTGGKVQLPDFENEEETLNFLLNEIYSLDCPHCGDHVCVSDMTVI